MNDRRSLRASFTWGALSALGLLLVSAPSSAAQLAAGVAADLDIEPYIEGLGSPTDVAPLPDGRVVAIERTGNIYTKPVGDGEPIEDHVDVNAGHGEQGLLGVVADPNFTTNQYIYFYASAGEDAANRHQVQRYKLGADGQLSDKRIVIEMGLRGPANHNGGALDIYQGNLYVGVGDTGANSRIPSNKFSSCLNVANGKVLRVSLDDGTLGQPTADNPLMNEAMVTGCDSVNGSFGMRPPEKRIFAWGFRNPFRLWVDRTNGKVWVGDVGEETKEEVSVIEKGNHAGYPFREGTEPYSMGQQPFQPAGACMGMVPATPCVAPVADWDRGGGGTAIGGRILDGCGWPESLKNRYIFGDHEQGKVWSIQVNATRDGGMGARADFANTNNIRALRMGTDNALYMVEGSGTVSRVTAKGAVSTPGSCATVDGPADPGGMAGAGGGGPGAAGSPGAAGNGNAAGSPAGGNGAGGNSPNPSTAGNSASGAGNSSTAGSPSAAGSGAGGSGGDSDSGCGCAVVGGNTTSLLGLGALGVALGVALGRRRRRD